MTIDSPGERQIGWRSDANSSFHSACSNPSVPQCTSDAAEFIRWICTDKYMAWTTTEDAVSGQHPKGAMVGTVGPSMMTGPGRADDVYATIAPAVVRLSASSSIPLGKHLNYRRIVL